MHDLPRGLLPSLVGAASGVAFLSLLLSRRRGASQPVPDSVVALWRIANSMPEGQCQLRILTGSPNKIRDIAAIRRACSPFDLRGAKYILDHTPELVGAGLAPETAAAVKRQLEASGMVVQIELRCQPQPLPGAGSNVGTPGSVPASRDQPL